MACSAGSCFIDRPLRRARPTGIPSAAPRRGIPLDPSTVADDAVVTPRAAIDPAAIGPAAIEPAGEACDACGSSCRDCAPCREKHGTDDVALAPAGHAAPEILTVPMRPRVSRPPAGAIVVGQVRPRSWTDLAPAERYALTERVLDALVDAATLARPAGEPVPSTLVGRVLQWQWDAMTPAEKQMARSGNVAGAVAAVTQRATGVSGFGGFATPSGGDAFDTRPEWAREAGIDQRTWTGMSPAQREEARARHVQNSNQGWQLAGTIIGAASQITQGILNGNLQTQLAQINATAQTNTAQAQAQSAQFVAQTNLQIAQLQSAAAAAAQQGNQAQAGQFQQAIQAMQAAQAQAQGQQNDALAAILVQMRQSQTPAPAGMSTGTMVGLGVGAAALLGVGVFVATRKGR